MIRVLQELIYVDLELQLLKPVQVKTSRCDQVSVLGRAQEESQLVMFSFDWCAELTIGVAT